MASDGGPAFPCPASPNEGHENQITGEWVDTSEWATSSSGMSLRDWFAGQAMTGDWAAQDEFVGDFTNEITDDLLDARACLYYRMADAMLRAREVPHGE